VEERGSSPQTARITRIVSTCSTYLPDGRAQQTTAVSMNRGGARSGFENKFAASGSARCAAGGAAPVRGELTGRSRLLNPGTQRHEAAPGGGSGWDW
jgi:hypothetical protein